MPGELPMPEMPDDFPPGYIAHGIKVDFLRAFCFDHGLEDLYTQYYREFKKVYSDRKSASCAARRKASYQLWNEHRDAFRDALESSPNKEPHQILAQVKKSKRTCDYDTLVDWVADHIIVPWESIDVKSIPDPKAVSLLVKAKRDKEGEDKFWADFSRRKMKTDLSVDDDESGFRKADKRSTDQLVSDWERAYDVARN